jgi:REP element-mobilizing transposase RayT
MTQNCAAFHGPRRSIRLQDSAYRAGEPFLLTACTAQGRRLFEDARLALAAVNAAREAAAVTGAALWCAVIMPDHAHLLVSATPGKTPLDTGSAFKRLTTRALLGLGHDGPVWQRRIHDRGIRTHMGQDTNTAVRYLLDNPVRRGLVTSWEHWPDTVVHEAIVVAR